MHSFFLSLLCWGVAGLKDCCSQGRLYQYTAKALTAPQKLAKIRNSLIASSGLFVGLNGGG